MSVLFLDPLVLGTYAVIGVGLWLVWRGAFRAWFGRGDTWTLLVWPLPLVIGGLPFVVGLVSGALGRLGIIDAEGGALTGAAYLIAYLGLGVWLILLPPRWLLPPWARVRCAPLPAHSAGSLPAGVPALHAWLGRGHACRSRWVWAVDAAPGHLWVEGGSLRFEALEDASGSQSFDAMDELDTAQFELRFGDDMRLVPPRGGWWTRRRVEVDLLDVDDWQVSETRPWSGDGLLTVRVGGRRPLRLWVADADAVRRAILTTTGPTATH